MRELARERAGGRRRRAARGENQNETRFCCFLELKHSALLFCQLQQPVLWCNESPGSKVAAINIALCATAVSDVGSHIVFRIMAISAIGQ